MNDLITIIVPVYNVEQYLERCVQSIVNQTYKNLEIILVDDGSTDNSGMLCDDFAENDNRIIVIHQENQGLGPARNAGLERMRGKYVGFVDSDDWVSLDTYQILYNAIIQNDCDVATCGRIVVSNNRILDKVYCTSEGQKLEGEQTVKHYLLQQDMNMSACDKLFRSSLFLKIRFPGDFYVSEDIVTIYSVLKEANGVYQTGEPLYNYYYRIGSLSRSKFTEKSMGTYWYSRDVAEKVRKEYPNLEKEANFFEYDGMITVWRLMRRCNYTGKEYDDILKNMKSNIGLILKNKYLYSKHKIFVVLVLLHLDGIADKAYLWIKQRRLLSSISGYKEG